MDGTTRSIRGCIRLVNQTLSCNGPWLVVLQYAQDAETLDAFNLVDVPNEWVRGGQVKLKAAKGTLVPAYGAVDPAIMMHGGLNPSHCLVEPMHTQAHAAPTRAEAPSSDDAPVSVTAEPTRPGALAEAGAASPTEAAPVAATAIQTAETPIVAAGRSSSGGSPEQLPDLTSKSTSGVSSASNTPMDTSMRSGGG